MRDGVNALENALFEQLRKLQGAEGDAVKEEIERSKAVMGIASQITENHRVALDASRLMSRPNTGVRLPKMLEDSTGGDEE